MSPTGALSFGEPSDGEKVGKRLGETGREVRFTPSNNKADTTK
jgi:hypothetical protein